MSTVVAIRIQGTTWIGSDGACTYQGRRMPPAKKVLISPTSSFGVSGNWRTTRYGAACHYSERQKNMSPKILRLPRKNRLLDWVVFTVMICCIMTIVIGAATLLGLLLTGGK